MNTGQVFSSETALHELVPSPEALTGRSAIEGEVLAHHARPSFLRSESNRRWTVAVAEVPDELLVAELERLRKMGMRAGEVHGIRSPTFFADEGVHSNSNTARKLKKLDNGTTTVAEEVEDEIEWGYARRAILCCRELVRTERSYQARLQDLADERVCARFSLHA